jgi:SAM-dependent methyltransferase
MQQNDKIYIHDINDHNPTSAKEIVPILIDMFSPKNVIDVGCGLGDWLLVFKDAGAERILGIDGEWVDKEKLYIDEVDFRNTDLTAPVSLDESFDLVICLEVAEHLPASAAKTLVKSLVSLGDTIIFSASVPDQGKGQNHINEQWPSYWADLFSEYDYHFYDIIRDRIWDNPKIHWWYRQNIFVVTKKDLPYPISSQALIHPEAFIKKNEEIDGILHGKYGMIKSLEILFNSLKSFIKRK